MKTRLLLFILFIFSFGNAQINVSESFETQFPTGWSTTGQSAGFNRGTSSYSCDQSYTLTAGLHSSNNHAMVVTSNYVSDGNSIVVSFQYNRGIGGISGNAYLYYDVNNAGAWQQIATSSDFSPGCKTLYAGISANSVPAGSNVRFRMQINSTSGVSVFIDNFKAIQRPFAFEYTFDNTSSNIDGLYPFALTNTVFVADRNSNANSAMQINLNASGSQAVISLLPKNNISRSFSLWYKTSSNVNTNIFTYGTACQDCNFGVYLGANGNPVFQSYISDIDFGGTYPANTWHHIVVTYNGTHVKLYMNGLLIGTQAYALVTGNNSYFRLGGNASTLTVDDLRMYDRVFTDAEVTNLYTNNSLTSDNFSANNLEVGLYPNPVNDVLNIDTKEELSSVEVYALQGQKVLSSKENKINVSQLPAGIYLVRIEDVNNNIATKKIVKKQ